MVVELLETYCRSHTYISLKNGAPSRLVKKVPNRSSIVIICYLLIVLLVHHWKIIAHNLASVEKLGKSELAKLVIDCQNKFDTVLNNINCCI